MYQITKAERKMLYRQANASRALYRALSALPYAAGLLGLIGFGMWVLK